MKWLFWKPDEKSMPVWELLLCFIPILAGIVLAIDLDHPPFLAAGATATMMFYLANKCWHLEA